MLLRVFLAALLVTVAFAIVKDGRLLHGARLGGACSVYANAVDGAQWVRCESGKLEGRPNLSQRGCWSAGLRGRDEYWHCPAAVVSSRTEIR